MNLEEEAEAIHLENNKISMSTAIITKDSTITTEEEDTKEEEAKEDSMMKTTINISHQFNIEEEGEEEDFCNKESRVDQLMLPLMKIMILMTFIKI